MLKALVSNQALLLPPVFTYESSLSLVTSKIGHVLKTAKVVA